MSDRRYALIFKPTAEKQIRKLDRQTARRIRAATEALRDNPWPFGVKAMKGQPGEYRIRVGDYRVVYEIHDDKLVVRVLQAEHRREIYDR